MGNRIVTVPISNQDLYDTKYEGDYCSLNNIETDDFEGRTIYLNPNSPVQDNSIWRKIYNE